MAAPSAGARRAVAIDAQRLASAVADIFMAVGIAAEDARGGGGGSGCRRPRGHRVARGDAAADVCRPHRQGFGVGVAAAARWSATAAARSSSMPAMRSAADRASGGQAGRARAREIGIAVVGRAQRLSFRHGRTLRAHDRRAELRRHRAVEHAPADAGAGRRARPWSATIRSPSRCPRPAIFRSKRTWR